VADNPGDHYARSRARLTSLLVELGEAAWLRPVPACPGWRVRDVLAHLLGNVEDAAAGRLQGPPDEQMTAEQVARHAPDRPLRLLARWDELAPGFEAAIATSGAWPAAIDLLTHELDIRHALDRPGARDDPLVAVAARLIAAGRSGDGFQVLLDGAPPVDPPGTGVVLRVSSFELLRVAMGRRTVEQVRALDWEGDPTEHVPGLFIFGPAPEPILEPPD
jgi:uncharacterized protein (TIGR03083 family)